MSLLTKWHILFRCPHGNNGVEEFALGNKTVGIELFAGLFAGFILREVLSLA